MKSSSLKFIDLFAGIGGIRLGLEQSLAKHSITSECVFSCEINQKAQETYFFNFDERPYADIRDIEKLPEHDILMAGFPCQAFSYAGKQKGFADTRGTLFFEIERLLNNIEKKPKYILLENVRGFTTHDNGRTFNTVLQRLDLLGYGVQHLLLNSSNFNVPQNRVRVYIICKLGCKPNMSLTSNLGYADSHKFKNNSYKSSLFSFEKSYNTVRDILEENVDRKYVCSDNFTLKLKSALNGKGFESLNGVRLIDYRGGNSLHSWELGLRGECTQDEIDFMNALIMNRRKKHFGEFQDGKRLTIEQIKTFWKEENLNEIIFSLLEKGYISEKNGQFNPFAGNMSFEVFKFLDVDSISITIVSSDADRLGVVANNIPRRITPRECARLQGFPDTFRLHPSDRYAYHQIGNSVSVPVVSAIFDDIIKNNPDITGN